MEPNSSSTCDSDPSLQTCVKCCLEKPIEHFVSRTNAKRPTKWCSDCRYHGNQGHKRWAASRKLRLEREKDSESQEKVNNGRSMREREGTETPIFSKIPLRVHPSCHMAPYMVPRETPTHENPETAYLSTIPERTQVAMPGQAAAYHIYTSPGYVPYMIPVPGNYCLPGAPANPQMVTPPTDPSAMYPMVCNHGHGAPNSTMQSAQWVVPNNFNAQPAVPGSNGTSTRVSGSQGSERTSSKNESSQEGTPYRGILSYGVRGKRFPVDTTSQDETPDSVTVKGEDSDNGDTMRVVSVKESSVSSSSSGVAVNGHQVQFHGWKEEKEKIGEGCQEEMIRVTSEDPESSPAPYFICLSCSTPRPTRLEDNRICVYCFEFPTQYCIQGGHEDDRSTFIDTDGRLHEVCNRCRSTSGPP